LYFGDRGLDGIRDRVELVVGDMRDAPREVFDDVETVVNVGGLSNDPTAEFNPRANYEMNMTATVALAQEAKRAGVSRYILASSCSIYDRGVVDETRDLLLDETAEVDPPGAYAGSKLAAESGVLPMASDTFCVTALRKATLFGFSRRMRYDLVVNTFVKDALSKGAISLDYGGEMWRPLADVHDAARAYTALISADSDSINGEVFNLVHRNYRISELALRVREGLRHLDIDVDIRTQYLAKGIRTYRVTGRKLGQSVGFSPELDIDYAVKDMVENIRANQMVDFDNPRYYNIAWMRLLEEAREVMQSPVSIFDCASRSGTPNPVRLRSGE
jgi:nucleoside-diphosphate-sugar epimerase